MSYAKAKVIFEFAETKDLAFYLDDDSFYFPTDDLNTIYYDDLSEIETSSLSMSDIVVISDLDDNYVFSESDISGINTIFDQGAMIIFIGFEKSFSAEYESEFNAIGIDATHNHRISVVSIYCLCNDEMMTTGGNPSISIHDYPDIIWGLITSSVVDMYSELEYVK